MLSNADAYKAIEQTVEITKAALAGTTFAIDSSMNNMGGKDVADFMQAVYDRLESLHDRS